MWGRSINGQPIAVSMIRWHVLALVPPAARCGVAQFCPTSGGPMLHRKVARWMPLVIAAFFVGRAAHAQTGRITGQVTDTASARPIAGVEITVVGVGDRALAAARTDESGKYTIANVAAGTARIRARMLGYGPKDST